MEFVPAASPCETEAGQKLHSLPRSERIHLFTCGESLKTNAKNVLVTFPQSRHGLGFFAGLADVLLLDFDLPCAEQARSERCGENEVISVQFL